MTINWLKCLLLFSLFWLLSACASNRNTKEYIIDTKYNQAIGGYKKGALFEIDKKCWYSDYLSDSIAVDLGIALSIDRKTSKLYRINVLTSANQRFMTSKGIKLGDMAQKAEDIYGKPISRWYSPGYLAGGLLEFPGLRYKDMLILVDTTTYKIIGIMIGDFSHSW